MNNTDTEEALHLAERLRQAIADDTVRVAGHSLSCTSSFGIAVSSQGSVSLEQLLSEADHAMYRAKSQGRNRVEAPVVLPSNGPQ